MLTPISGNGGPAIYLDGIQKSYPRDLTIRSFLAFAWGGASRKQVLRDVSLSIPTGEVVGVIGPNGAGKSTLLKIIAGHVAPSEGKLVTRGRILSILEIATGLQVDRTGRENIGLLGPLYGMSDETIATRMDEIVAFSELGKFIDYPVRAYSAGMRARLAFSLITSADCDILLIDEALSVGDAGFARRCRQRMRQLCENGQTVLIVSHSTIAIQELCDRVVWLDEGRIVATGTPRDIVEHYRLDILGKAERDVRRRYARSHRAECSRDFGIVKLGITSGRGAAPILAPDAPFAVEAVIRSNRPMEGAYATLSFVRVDGVLIAKCRSPNIDLRKGDHPIRTDFESMRLGRFAYECQLKLHDRDGTELAESTIVFVAEDSHHTYNSTYYQPVEWAAGSVRREHDRVGSNL
jgi:ABC-type polysaccharide/polyol phosphate transport system ATPase subunit